MKTLVLLWLAIFVMAMISAPEKINKQAERIFGYSRAELLGKPIDTLLSEQPRAGANGMDRPLVPLDARHGLLNV